MNDQELRIKVYEMLATRSQKLSKPDRRIIDSFNADDEFATEMLEAVKARDQQIALEARKPLERILDEQGWNRCEDCNDFLPTNDECICENCDSMFHEGCAGYVYNGDGESAYAICKGCFTKEDQNLSHKKEGTTNDK